MRPPQPLPDSLGPDFTVAEALERGVTRDRLRARDLVQPFTGARSVAAPDDVRSRALALAPLLDADQYFSHLTSAQLLGLRMPERRLPPALHLTYRYAHRAMRRPGVTGHKTVRPARIVRVDGIPVSSPLDAWCESAPLLGLDELVAMGDGLVARRSPLAQLVELQDAVRSRGTTRVEAVATRAPAHPPRHRLVA